MTFSPLQSMLSFAPHVMHSIDSKNQFSSTCISFCSILHIAGYVKFWISRVQISLKHCLYEIDTSLSLSAAIVCGVRVTRSLVFCVVICRSLFVFLSFFFLSFHCLSFFDLRILIPLQYLHILQRIYRNHKSVNKILNYYKKD